MLSGCATPREEDTGEHKVEAASVPTRGLSSLGLGLPVHCQQARVHTVRRVLKPQ